MRSHHTSSLTLALLAVLMTVAPSCAFGNSLLSGYGGPGEGNQAILGSALLGGGTGGGSGSSGGSSSGDSSGLSGSSSADAGAVGQAGTGNATSTGTRGQGSKDHPNGRRVAGGAAGSHGNASAGAALAYPVSTAENTGRSAAVASETLGLSGGDLTDVLLVLGALALTGVVTGRLVRMTQPEGL
jgi:hypothetical protein